MIKLLTASLTPLLLALLCLLPAGCRPKESATLAQIKAGAQRGDPVAQHNLGVMHANGLEVPRDYAEAARWFRAAADQGLAVAQYDLAVLYDNGRGVALNRAEAAAWYRRAALQGNAFAQYNLAVLHGTGDGVPRDGVEAYVWLALAAPKLQIAQRDLLALEKKLPPEMVAQARARVEELRVILPPTVLPNSSGTAPDAPDVKGAQPK
jgi:hypothetical protein